MMHKYRGIIALDLDGTLLNSQKELTEGNRLALQKAYEAGFAIVPTTGRFYGAMPEAIRTLPFVEYAITINGACVEELKTGNIIYRADFPWQQAVSLMEYLDTTTVIYDCYTQSAAYMTAAMKGRVNDILANPHYRRMLHELRQNVPELKSFLQEKKTAVQKVQFFTNDPQLRLALMEEIPHRFKGLIVSSAIPENAEINAADAHKGAALMALAKHLGVAQKSTYAFGDGLNDVTMLRMAGTGIAMDNASDEIKAFADVVTASCDEDGVALGIKTYCFEEV